MTYFTPSSSKATGLTSPVKAPQSSKCIFCAPTSTSEFFDIETKLSRNNEGEQTMGSILSFAGTIPLISPIKVFASGSVLYIFQFPAIIGLRILLILSNIYKENFHQWGGLSSPTYG